MLAADRRACTSSAMLNTLKIRRVTGGRLIGVAGSAGVGFTILDWLSKSAKMRGERPDFADCSAIEILPSGEIWEYEAGGSFVNRDKHTAIGSGRDYAMMAMHLGKDAADAVSLTGLFDPSTGGGVDVLYLKAK